MSIESQLESIRIVLEKISDNTKSKKSEDILLPDTSFQELERICKKKASDGVSRDRIQAVIRKHGASVLKNLAKPTYKNVYEDISALEVS